MRGAYRVSFLALCGEVPAISPLMRDTTEETQNSEAAQRCDIHPEIIYFGGVSAPDSHANQGQRNAADITPMRKMSWEVRPGNG